MAGILVVDPSCFFERIQVLGLPSTPGDGLLAVDT
jgi:hypothetical protein